MNLPRGSVVAMVLVSAGVVVAVSVVGSTGAVVVESTDGERLLSSEAGEGAIVALEYTHSVEKTPVKDIYVVEGEKLVFNRTEFSSFGAGLPTGDVELNDDGTYVHRPERKQTQYLTVSTGYIADHELVVDGTRHNLTQIAEGGTVRIYVTRGLTLR